MIEDFKSEQRFIPGIGTIQLVDVSADDLMVVNAARVSFGKKKKKMDESDRMLIAYLMREQHGSPFEHNFFMFHVRAPIFVAREWFRHRIGWSYNEYSGRYSQMQSDYYLPSREDLRTQDGKPGHYEFTKFDGDAESILAKMAKSNSSAWDTYNELLAAGVAKELARTVLPVGWMTEFYASTNARALMNFIQLRAAPSAQYEIRQYAYQLEEILEEQMPETARNFNLNAKVAP